MSDLTLQELQVDGGTWSGLLFENPTTGYPLTLSWTFTVDFVEIERDYGEVAPSLTIDWVPAGTSSWDSLAGRSFAGRHFADPIESSFYFFDHFRFDHARVVIKDQDAGTLYVEMGAGGDIDGLGLAEVTASASLSFAGIYVQTESTGIDADAATSLLARFTNVDGLQPRVRQHNVLFEQST